MYPVLLIIIVIAAILMVGIVLIQESKGGGLASNFSTYNQIGGVRKTTDFIEKTTWSLAAAMVIISVLCAYTAPKSGQRGAIVNEIQAPAVNPNNAQGIEAAPIETPAGAEEAAPAAPAQEATQE
ncbi:MAG: preprotein translocase subunit SecG [Prevotella sp.]|nr:preprotein translocase subunit SecG [Prevotella sp.]